MSIQTYRGLSHRGLGWWYWLATAVLLIPAIGLARPEAAVPVIALTVVQSIHYRSRCGAWSAFPVQVRTSYLGILVLGLVPPLEFLHWIQLAGTWAVVTVDYCPLARVLALAPWNRGRPLTLGLVRKTLLSPPVAMATGLITAR